MNDTKAALLCIGHEVVEGRVINTNGSWLAQELENMGISCITQLCVRDIHQEIDTALHFLKDFGVNLILTTGGLGPTRDDLTTESVGAWLSRPLMLSETAWDDIRDKLNKRQVTVRPGHKRQALIPKGSQVLPNPVGVAPGFFVNLNKELSLASLPGPPSEMKGIFNQCLKPILQETFKPRKNEKLRTWICLGAAESEVAHIVESVIGESMPLGFRLQRPYVEVRLWCPSQLSSDQERRIQLMEDKLKQWLVGDSIEAIRKGFHQKLTAYDFVFVVDQLSRGLLLDRLREYKTSDHIRYQCFEHKSYRHFSKNEVGLILSTLIGEKSPRQLFLSLFPASAQQAWLAINDHIIEIDLPRSLPLASQLGQLYVIERCFLETIRLLTKQLHP